MNATSQRSISQAGAGRACTGATRSLNPGSILSDLEAGEEPILLADLPRQSFMPRGRGRKNQRRPLHGSVPHRWSTSGKDGHRLETIRTPSGLVTTRSAALRFFAALSGGSVATSTPGQTRRAHERAERELEAAGI